MRRGCGLHCPCPLHCASVALLSALRVGEPRLARCLFRAGTRAGKRLREAAEATEASARSADLVRRGQALHMQRMHLARVGFARCCAGLRRCRRELALAELAEPALVFPFCGWRGHFDTPVGWWGLGERPPAVAEAAAALAGARDAHARAQSVFLHEVAGCAGWPPAPGLPGVRCRRACYSCGSLRPCWLAGLPAPLAVAGRGGACSFC